MKWQEDGILLNTHTYGESRIIASVLTREKGRTMGVMHKGKNIPQIGSIVQASWNARLENHLGRFQLETIEALNFSILESPLKSAILGSLLFLCHKGLAERNPYPNIYDSTLVILKSLHVDSNRDCVKNYVLFELILLKELGFGLDLSKCAVDGGKENLIYISPKSGRSVSKTNGEAYKDRLLKLPQFMLNPINAAEDKDFSDSLYSLGYFLEKHIFCDSGLPMHRARISKLILEYVG